MTFEEDFQVAKLLQQRLVCKEGHIFAVVVGFVLAGEFLLRIARKHALENAESSGLSPLRNESNEKQPKNSEANYLKSLSVICNFLTAWLRVT